MLKEEEEEGIRRKAYVNGEGGRGGQKENDIC